MFRAINNAPGDSLFLLLLSLAILLGGLILLTPHSFAEAATATGPLRVLSSNPRYFTDGSGKVVYLTGSHTWNNLQDRGSSDPPPAFNYRGYLNLLVSNNLNFIRLWRWELTRTQIDTQTLYAAPHPWRRTGPGTATDGKPKFDLNRFNQAYFVRLRSRVIAARDRGIYVSIMLFEGWALQFSDPPWREDGHPMAASNNINGINGDPNGDGYLTEAHTLQIPAIVDIQKAYVRKVIDTVNDLNNVLYEIANEDHSGSVEWQKAMTKYIKSYEANQAQAAPGGHHHDFIAVRNNPLLQQSGALGIAHRPSRTTARVTPMPVILQPPNKAGQHPGHGPYRMGYLHQQRHVLSGVGVEELPSGTQSDSHGGLDVFRWLGGRTKVNGPHAALCDDDESGGDDASKRVGVHELLSG